MSLLFEHANGDWMEIQNQFWSEPKIISMNSVGEFKKVNNNNYCCLPFI